MHARYLEARAAAGVIYAPRLPVAWWGDFARELVEFPAGAHDDQVDAFGYALDIALPLSGWDQHFAQERAKLGALPDPKAPKTGGCDVCHAPFGSVIHESTRLPGLYCSERCIEIAAKIAV